VPAFSYADRPGPLAAGGLSSREIPRAPAALSATTVAVAGLDRTLRRPFAALGGVGEIIVIAYAFPLAILAIGTPIALLIRLVLWIVRAL
jgi:hypothetical protein